MIKNLQHWSIDACKAYAKQLRDKTRANTADHAAEAIEYLIRVVDTASKREWVGLSAKEVDEITDDAISVVDALLLTESKLKEKNT